MFFEIRRFLVLALALFVWPLGSYGVDVERLTAEWKEAVLLHSEGSYGAAIKAYLAIIQQYPGLLKPAYQNVAALLIHEGRRSEAVLVLESYLTTHTDDAAILADLAIALSQSTDKTNKQRAFELAKRSLEFEPDKANALHVLGNVAQDLGMHTEARGAFARLEALGEQSSDGNTTAWTRPSKIQLVDAFADLPSPHQPTWRLISTSPWVLVVDDFLSSTECEALRLSAEPNLLPSYTYADGLHGVSPPRVSETAWLHLESQDKHLVAPVQKRALHVLGINTRRAPSAEPAPQLLHAEMQVVKYTPGGYYTPHVDATRWHMRHVTVLYYLNDDYEGGHTSFVNMTAPLDEQGMAYKTCGTGDGNAAHWSVLPRKGRAVFFASADEDGSGPDLASFHAGCAVQHGTKWLANHWFSIK